MKVSMKDSNTRFREFGYEIADSVKDFWSLIEEGRIVVHPTLFPKARLVGFERNGRIIYDLVRVHDNGFTVAYIGSMKTISDARKSYDMIIDEGRRIEQYGYEVKNFGLYERRCGDWRITVERQPMTLSLNEYPPSINFKTMISRGDFHETANLGYSKGNDAVRVAASLEWEVSKDVSEILMTMDSRLKDIVIEGNGAELMAMHWRN